MQSTLLAAATTAIWNALRQQGHDAHAIFVQAGLDPSALTRPGERFRFDAIKRLWALALETTRDPCLGIKVGQLWHPSGAHALGFAWLASDTLHEAFTRLVRYYRIVSTDKEKVEFKKALDEYIFRWDDDDAYYAISDAEYDEGFAAIVRVCRLSAGGGFAPLRLEMRRPPPPCRSEFDEYFRCEIRYSTRHNSMFLDPFAIEAALPTGNIQIARECDRIADAYLARIDRKDVVARARARILEQLPSGNVTEDNVANALHLSLRSMQRRLSEGGTNFKRLLDDTRRELALQYIRDPIVTINEMTYLLGYSEPANFSRAFKRWTGQSPRAARAA